MQVLVLKADITALLRTARYFLQETVRAAVTVSWGAVSTCSSRDTLALLPSAELKVAHRYLKGFFFSVG